jgi:hypothetical protein
MKSYINRTIIVSTFLVTILCCQGCVIVSEIVIINSTDKELIIKDYLKLSGEYIENDGYTIKPSEFKAFTGDLRIDGYIEVWVGDFFVAKIDYPNKAIATEVKISGDEQGGYLVKGKYTDIGEYGEEYRPARKRKHSISRVPFSD